MQEDRRIRKTKKAIKDTLIELLKQNPINKISVTELTQKADISRKTFYLHYSSVFDAKNDIDNDIIGILHSILDTLPKELRENDIMSFFNLVNEKAQCHKELITYFLNDSKSSALYSCVKSTLKDAIIVRLSNNENNIHNEYIVEFVVSGILNSFMEWNSNENLPAEDFSLLLTHICTNLSTLIK